MLSGRKLAAVGLFLLALAWAPGLAFAQTVHVLVVADTGDRNVGKAVAIDQGMLSMIFKGLVPKRQLDLRTLSDDDVSWERIVGEILRIRAAPADAVVFFYSGHGAYDEKGHFFDLPDGQRLYRSTVVREVARRGANMDVVLSSSCNVFKPKEIALAPAMGEPRERIAPILDQLLFRSHGLVDINGASEGEYGFANPEFGTTFTFPLCMYVAENSQRRVTWDTLVRDVRPLVQQQFLRLFPDGYTDPDSGRVQKTQSLRVWRLPPGWPDNVRGRQLYTQLEPNDVIRSINGKPIRNENEFREAVTRSPSQMVFTIRNSRDGQTMHLKADLLPPGGSRFGVYVSAKDGDGVSVSSVMAGYPGTKVESLD